MSDENPFDKIDALTKKFASDMNRHVSSFLDAYPNANDSEAKEYFFLQKIATLIVGMEIQKKELEQIKLALNKSGS